MNPDIAADSAGRPNGEATGSPFAGLLASFEARQVRYCHWKSNVRLAPAVSGVGDLDLLVHRADAQAFHAALAENGFRRATAPHEHPGAFHFFALDQRTLKLIHVHAYFRIFSGDSLVKSHRFPIEDQILGNLRVLDGIQVPKPEHELVLFVMRIALKHTSAIETVLVSRHYDQVVEELRWLRSQADMAAAEEIWRGWLPRRAHGLFLPLLAAIADERMKRRRRSLGRSLARELRHWRRIQPLAGSASRARRLLSKVLSRLRRRREKALETGGAIVALVGPKATGKSTLSQAVAQRLGTDLSVRRIHAGKPPMTLLTLVPRLFLPLLRMVRPSRDKHRLQKELDRPSEMSLVYVVRVVLLAFERRSLLLGSFRAACSGTIIISDRYPSAVAGAADSSCFTAADVAACRSWLKRRLMEVERRLYDNLPTPDVVVRLHASLESALHRDAHRKKEGGPDAQAVQLRRHRETQSEFPGARVIPVETEGSLDDTIRTVTTLVWAAL